ncbi:restriction endonuclease subunit S [Rhodoferax sp.]|uniref:restriction endonuclease subunit S n=1 Tax=Rhodoferax sp. TaxID=50421 RepID=UPI00374DD2F6
MTSTVWTQVALGAYCSKIGSGSTPRGGDSVYVEAGTALVRSQNVYNGEFAYGGLAFIDDPQADALKGVTLKADDVLLNITGDSVARCCVVPADVLPARVNQHVAIIRPGTGEFDARFLAYYFISPFMQQVMLSMAGGGGTRKALTKEMIERFAVPKPPLQSQERIVSLLAGYDDLIANNRRRIQLLEDSVRLLFDEWFVRLRFPGHESSTFVDGVPQGWSCQPLRNSVVLHYGKALKAEVRSEGGAVPVYGSSGIVGTHDKALVKGPGIVVGRKGNVGSVFWSSGDFHPIDTVYFLDAATSDLYLYCALQRMQFISTDVAVPGLNRDLAYSRPLLLPPDGLKLQFLELASPIRAQIDTLTALTDKLRTARDLLLPRLMSGELSV